MSFTGLCDDLRYTTTLTYQFELGNSKCVASWKDGLQIETSGQAFIFSEDELSELWDHIRIQGIVPLEDGNVRQALFYRLLNQMGYLSSVRILGREGTSAQSGYQLNEGYGRVFELQGGN